MAVRLQPVFRIRFFERLNLSYFFSLNQLGDKLVRLEATRAL